MLLLVFAAVVGVISAIFAIGIVVAAAAVAAVVEFLLPSLL